MLEGYPSLDHSNIARFIKDYLGSSLEDLFYQLIQKLNALGEVQYKNLFIDGTKLEANANKYSFVWKKVINKNEAKMHLRIKELFSSIDSDYITTVAFDEEKPLESLEQLYDFLLYRQEVEQVTFVHGIGKRKSSLQKYIEATKGYIERQQKYDYAKSIFEGRNSYSKTDTDATFMHMKDDHMRNAQLKPGYNIQIGVESEYVTAIDVFADRSDTTTLIPFLDHMHQQLGVRCTNIIADAGYESEENYLYLEEHQQKPFIKPVMYEKWKKKSFKRDISKRENMSYNTEEDYYTCANNQVLQQVKTQKRKSASGYISEVTVYACANCEGCALKSKCTKAQGNRQLYVSKQFIKKREQSYENIKTDEGTLLRMNRSIQVEGAFGVLKWDRQFTRFLRRGKNNVKNEFMLHCFAYNINKLHNKIQNNRCSSHLHPLKTA